MRPHIRRAVTKSGSWLSTTGAPLPSNCLLLSITSSMPWRSAAAGDTGAARTAAAAAERALTVGVGASHPLARTAEALVASLKTATP
jgi:hypothetical protein